MSFGLSVWTLFEPHQRDRKRKLREKYMERIWEREKNKGEIERQKNEKKEGRNKEREREREKNEKKETDSFEAKSLISVFHSNAFLTGPKSHQN